MEALEGFWNDINSVAKVQKEKSLLQSITQMYVGLEKLYEECEIMLDMAFEEDDEEAAIEGLNLFEKFLENFHQAEQKMLLSDEVDPNNAIVSITPGAGGTESCDWAYMLLRMITRWAEGQKCKITILDHQNGDTAGIKAVTMMIEGAYAYGMLRSESGIHRLVRISPFDSNARRHTSFASVFVSPELDDEIEIDIQDKDLKIDVYRSGGAGGQSVNTTDSAVRITHLPSGIVVTCQNERSQLQNKAQAMKVLRSRLYDLALEEQREKNREIESGKKEIGWGSQIRSYVLHPYKLVKDHRTNFEVGSPDKVLDGELDSFMDAFLRWRVSSETKG